MKKDVLEILDKILETNHDAYVVGGAVRDMLMNKQPHDYDIATNLPEHELEKIFPKNYPSGKAFGIITIFYNNEEYEVAHFRNDGTYTDNRHCDVEMVDTIEEDLKRRDFTINAMAYNKNGLVDLFGGKQDIENKIIRAVGNPDERIKEDALRMLRAIRFSAQLGFQIDSQLYEAIKKNANLIKNISFERIEAEITKILTSDHPEKFLELYNCGLTKYIMPEFDKIMECEQNNPYHIYSVGIHTIEALKSIDKDKILRWTMLLHDFGKPAAKTTGEDGIDHFYDHPLISIELAKNILNRFKFSNIEKDEILKLIEHHDMYTLKIHKARLYVAKYGIEFFDKLKKVQLADAAGQSSYKQLERYNNINLLNSTCHEVYEDKTAIKMSDLEINGNDLLKIGFKGEKIGIVLKELYEICLCNPDFNNRDKLINKCHDLFNSSTKLDDIIKKYDNRKNKQLKEINTKNIDISKEI